MGLGELVGPAGYRVFDADARTLAWAAAANRVAGDVLANPEARETGLVCEGTWFVGVDALPNDPTGAIHGVPLAGPATDGLAPLPALHPAQISVTFPGYPKPRAGESAAAFRYRQRRDAAHVDGILVEGLARRRFVREPHAFILGIALNESAPDAAPLVVWEGSHLTLQAAFRTVFEGVNPADQAGCDITECYTDTRRRVFDTHRRVPLPLQPGQAVLLHPLLLHGVAPWSATTAAPEGRRIAYFRPQVPTVGDWLAI